VPDRLRPEDRMVAHTGYLVFATVHKDSSPTGAEETGTASPDLSENGSE